MIDKWILLGILALVCLCCSMFSSYLGYQMAGLLFLVAGIYYGIIAIMVFPPETKDKNARPRL
jgi:uncharacterized membrane protein